MTDMQLPAPYNGEMAWRASELPDSAGVIRLGSVAQAELKSATEILKANPLPTEGLSHLDFDMSACLALMQKARTELDSGLGFVIIDRLDVSDRKTAAKLYWLLMDMTAPLVAQKHDGTMIYDVLDTGLVAQAGNGVRASKTRNHQGFHTDNSFNMPPDYVALFCMQTAMEGGLSGLISFQTVYNRLRESLPDKILARMFEPFWFDRQYEHAEGDDPVTVKPAFAAHADGGVEIAFSPRLVRQGADVKGIAMDARAEQALAAIAEVTEDADLGVTLEFQPGQIQIVNNKRIGHRRTGFTDWPDAERRRHLVRLWMRNTGGPFYSG